MLGDFKGIEDIVAKELENSAICKAVNIDTTIKNYIKQTPTWVASTLASIAKIGYTYGVNNIKGDSIEAAIDAAKQGAYIFTIAHLCAKACEYLAKNYTNSNPIKRNLYWLLPSAVLVAGNFALHYGTGTEAPFYSAVPSFISFPLLYGWGKKTRAQYNIPKPEK